MILPIKHLKQIQALKDDARFKFFLVGRRGGKTTGFREDALKAMSECPPRGEIFYIGPTNQQAMELVWDDLEERLDEMRWQHKPRSSKQRIEFTRGRKLYVIGAEKIRRIRGHKVFRAYLDELAYFDVDLNHVWKAVRPALSDLKGSAFVGTTPNGKGTQAYDFYLETLKKPEWKSFSWNTGDNPFIDPMEIEAAKREMDEKSFRQEYLATWESFEGMAYYNFEESLHIKKCPPLDPSLPLGLTLDFNVNPTSLVLVQMNKGHCYFKKEYSQKNSSTIDTFKTFCEDMKGLKDHLSIEIYGDSTGASRKSATGRSDYFYIEEMLTYHGFRFSKRVPGVNPPIVDRVAYVNGWLKNVYGESRITIDPSCTDTIRDLSSQPLEGRFPSDKNNLGHKADAVGYYISWQHLMGQRKPQRTLEL